MTTDLERILRQLPDPGLSQALLSSEDALCNPHALRAMIDVLDTELADHRRLQARHDAEMASLLTNLPFAVIGAAVAAWLAEALATPGTPAEGLSTWIGALGVLALVTYGVIWAWHEEFFPWVSQVRNKSKKVYSWRGRDKHVKELELQRLAFQLRIRELESARQEGEVEALVPIEHSAPDSPENA